MDKDVQKRLFEPFFTHSEEAGTGLGLCVVKNVVEAHGGKLTYTSEKGKGTTFRIARARGGVGTCGALAVASSRRLTLDRDAAF